MNPTITSYSPELNPMEQVWQKLKKSYLSNTAFKDYDSIVDACCNAWNVFCDQDGSIKNLVDTGPLVRRSKLNNHL